MIYYVNVVVVVVVAVDVVARVQTLAHFVADKQNKKFSFIVEDRVTVSEQTKQMGRGK